MNRVRAYYQLLVDNRIDSIYMLMMKCSLEMWLARIDIASIRIKSPNEHQRGQSEMGNSGLFAHLFVTNPIWRQAENYVPLLVMVWSGNGSSTWVPLDDLNLLFPAILGYSAYSIQWLNEATCLIKRQGSIVYCRHSMDAVGNCCHLLYWRKKNETKLHA